MKADLSFLLWPEGRSSGSGSGERNSAEESEDGLASVAGDTASAGFATKLTPRLGAGTGVKVFVGVFGVAGVTETSIVGKFG